MDIRDLVANRIQELCKERNITINRLSYISGVPDSTIRGIFYKRSNNPGIVTIKKLCDGFEIELGRFFDTDEFNMLEQEIK
ncbi:MAG: helix-turn-helix transcriptional regulator [Oscillospiraceae bacterium]|nr:helix-turn-helix transcriptional regulator [Oscillospiraceae bacterium]